MKIELTLNKQEMMAIMGKMIPAELFPKGSEITELEVHGYPIREYTVTIESRKGDKEEIDGWTRTDSD